MGLTIIQWLFGSVLLVNLVIAIAQNNENSETPENIRGIGLRPLRQQILSYGEQCTTDVQCNSDAFFSCINGTCSCNPERYSLNTNPTTLRNGTKFSCIDFYNEVIADGENRNCGGNIFQCHESSSCISVTKLCDGLNDCANGSDELPIMCKGCRNGYGTVLIDTEPLPECVGLANKDCNAQLNCVSNSKCFNGICVCNSGYAPTTKGICGAVHGRKCSSERPCGFQFICTRGSCDCPSPEYQKYDVKFSTEKCRSIIRGPCDTNQDCGENASCVMRQNEGYKSCQCHSGFVENYSGACDIAFGGSCQTADQNRYSVYGTSYSISCDTQGSLSCRNGICSCPDTMTRFDTNLRKCLAVAGSKCPLNEKYAVCVENSTCVFQHSQTYGTCICNVGFSSTAERLCI